jgi:hypothetical protein
MLFFVGKFEEFQMSLEMRNGLGNSQCHWGAYPVPLDTPDFTDREISSGDLGANIVTGHVLTCWPGGKFV